MITKYKSKDIMKKSYISFVVLVTLLLAASRISFAQASAGAQYGGTSDIFDYQVGARAMAMGGAYVTVADDPFALYWNPAALENVPAMGIGFYHTNLPAGTQYDFVSFIYPTLNFGTFSAGLLRIGTGDIEIRDFDASLQGTQDQAQNLYLIGYGKKLFSWMSVGATAKIEYSVFAGNEDPMTGSYGSYTESAIGADVGLLISSPWSGRMLRNWLVGFNYQNAIQRAIQLEDVKLYAPRDFRFGMSRKFGLSQGLNHFLLAFELDNSSAEDVPNYMHFGGEFSFRDAFMLRLGWNRRGAESDGYGLTYGLGVRHMGFQIDYSYYNGVDAMFGSSHRISVVATIGRTKVQKLAEIQSERDRLIAEQAQQQFTEERENAYHSGLAQAREYFKKGDLPHANASINKVLSFDDAGENPAYEDARELARQINAAIDEERTKSLDDEIARTREETEIRQRQRMVQEHYDNASAFLETEQFREAIVECDRALELDPKNNMILRLRKLADEDLRKKIAEMISTAGRLANNGRTFDALQYYNRALPLAQGLDKIESFISGNISKLDGKLAYENLIRRAVDYENQNQWKDAANLYDQARKSNPNNKEIQKRYREAHARANAKQMEMTPQVKALYTKGYRELSDGNYDEAISFYEQALELQPLNKTILRALDHARNQKRRANTAAAAN
jgi:tetratricopeptide (TPR) repeat protein